MAQVVLLGENPPCYFVNRLIAFLFSGFLVKRNLKYLIILFHFHVYVRKDNV